MTRMARLAATEYGADWVINSDADEFWWPRGASLAEVLGAVPPRYGTVGAFLRVFCPRPGEEQFAERMTVRFSALAPINDPASLYKPIRKIVHRGHPEIRVTRGNHALVDSPFAPLRGWFPIECFHFPLRSVAQCEHKARAPGHAFEKHIAGRRPPTTRTCTRRSGAAGSPSTTRRSSSPTRSSSAGSARAGSSSTHAFATRSGSSATSKRGLPSAGARSRPPTFPLPTLVEDAEYAVEAAVLGEADVVRLQRRLDSSSAASRASSSASRPRVPEAHAHRQAACSVVAQARAGRASRRARRRSPRTGGRGRRAPRARSEAARP